MIASEIPAAFQPFAMICFPSADWKKQWDFFSVSACIGLMVVSFVSSLMLVTSLSEDSCICFIIALVKYWEKAQGPVAGPNLCGIIFIRDNIYTGKIYANCEIRINIKPYKFSTLR